MAARLDTQDTIVAVATPPGPSACGILRISGPNALAVAARLFQATAGPGLAARAGGSVVHGEISLPLAIATAAGSRASAPSCPALAYLMRAPGSYTAEDVVELHLPGSPPLLASALRAACQAGARVAEAGEFTLRAFLHGRIDLGQAESVERVIAAEGEAERCDAVARLSSDLGRSLAAWQQTLLDCAAQVEAFLDLEEPEAGGERTAGLPEALTGVAAECRRLAAQASADRPCEAGVRVRLAGPTNTGKSSLANALAGREVALASPEPSFTRDRLSFPLDVGGVRIVVEDAPGADAAADGVGRAAAERSLRELGTAGVVCLVLDLSAPVPGEGLAAFACLAGRPVVAACNKADRLAGEDRDARLADLVAALRHTAGVDPLAAVATSARTGAGLSRLRQALAGAVLGELALAPGGRVSAREGMELFHAAAACERALAFVGNDTPWELVAEEVRAASLALGRARGADYGEDVLRAVFSRFCVGK